MSAAKPNTSEIRLRAVSPDLVKKLTAIQVESREPTTTGAIMFLIGRYDDMKKVINEQRKDIAVLSQKLRATEQQNNTMKYDYEYFAVTINQFSKNISATAKHAIVQSKKFGTKRKPAGNKKPTWKSVIVKKSLNRKNIYNG